MRKHTFLLLAGMASLTAYSQTKLQKIWGNWMGAPFGIATGTGTPYNFYTTGNQSGVTFPWTTATAYTGGMAVGYSDSMTGLVKFTAGPGAVYNRNYDTVTNGYGLITCGIDGKDAVLVIPFPDGQNKFYIIHQFPASSLSIPGLQGLQTRCSVYSYATGNQPGVRYSVLDLNYNNGLGLITSKNNYLPGAGGEKFAQIRHANGKNMWLLGHAGGSGFITQTLFHETGLQGFAATAVPFPTTAAPNSWTTGGSMEASPQGNKLAVTSGSNKRINLYNFNSTTGAISFDVSILLPEQASQLCFSPDGTKLYAATYAYPNCGNTIYKLYQIDLSAPDPEQSLYEVHADYNATAIFYLQRITGNRILFSGRYVYPPNGYTQTSYHAITYPNQPQNACTLEKDVFLTDFTTYMPATPNDVVREAPEAPALNFNFPKDTTVCLGNYTLTAPTGYGAYRWSTGETGQSITVTQPGNYSVLAGAAGFTKPAAFGFTRVKAKALPLNLGPDTLLCPKSIFNFNIAAGFTNILWQNGDTSRNHAVTYPGGKQVITAVDANGCRVKDSVCVRINYYPRAEFGNDTTLCAGQRVTLRMEPMQLFNSNVVCLWSDGSTKDSLRVTAPGRYWGRITYNGCTVSDTIQVDFINPVTVNLGRDTTLCAGDSLRIGINNPNFSYQWSNGATSSHITVYAPGTYIIRATNGRCVAFDTIVVGYNQRPQFSLGADKLICPGESVTLTAPIPGSYLWSTGLTSANLQTAQAGLYWLQVTANGCAGRDTILVTQKPLPVVALGNDTTLCEGDTKTLDVFNTGGSYLWSNGSVNSTYTITAAGTVAVTVTLNGCVKRDTISVRYNKAPLFTLGADTVICSGTMLTLEPPLQRGNYAWQDGSSDKKFVVRMPGMYRLEVSNECGHYADTALVHATLCELLMPNAFTPNGDGINDLFLIKYPQYLQRFTMTVYNRRGETLYQTSVPGQGWDGTYRGKRMPTETYVWKIDHTDVWGVAASKWGTVTLIR